MLRIALAATALFFAVAPASLWAQAATAASITGRVVDDSGAAMPGVTVRVTSPALQVPEVTTTTDAQGNYRLVDLPAPGVFRAAFSREGFQTFVRDGLNLSVGFDARVDVTMKLGQTTQTVEVTGSTPVVDTVNTSGGTTLQLMEIAETPKGVGLEELFPMAAGVSMQGKPDVGDSNLANRQAIITYGVLLQPALLLEGIDIGTAHDLDTAVYLDTYALAEAQLTTVGNNADVAFPGLHMEAVLKSGSNSFHGSLIGDYENSSFQGSNVTPALAAQGIKVTNPLTSYFDYSADLGGRIIRDKLWFYGGVSMQKVLQGQLGIVGAPDAKGCWTCLDAPVANLVTALPEHNIKISYQMNDTTRFVFAWAHGNKFFNANGAGSTVPLPSAEYEHQPDDMWKVGITKTFTPRLLLDLMGGFGGYHVYNIAEPGTDKPGNPASQETTTKFYTGTYPAPTEKPELRYQAKGILSYIRGRHQFKFGTDVTWEEGDTYTKNKLSGDYLLTFNQGLPTQVTLYNFPVIPENHLYSQAVFATDSWKLGRVVLNYGVRWERYHTFYPEQTKAAGPFSAATTYPGRDLLTWKDVVPRVGGAWDIFGNGKTVLKGSFGIFGDTMGYNFANTFNPNAQVSTTYRWNGPCVQTEFNNVSYNNTSCDISPATLATLNSSSPSFISATGGLNQIVNSNLKQNKTYEYSAKLERQIVPNVALSAAYVHHAVYYLTTSAVGTTTSTANGVTPLRPYSAYNVPVTLSDVLTHAPVTVYTYPSSFAGAAYNQLELTNASGSKHDTYDSYEVAITKRYSKRWNALASFWITKNHQWIQAISPSPNSDPFPIDNTWNWEARADAFYTMPWGFELSGFYRAQSGLPGQRTESFSSPLLLQGAVTMRMEPFGAQRGPTIQIANMKFAKNFIYRERFRAQANFQVFNILNGSAATSTSYLTGPTYQHITGIVSPRVARVGLQFSF
jgi:hypothetical protein